MDVFEGQDFETVFIGIFDVVVVGKAGAVGTPVIERVVASGLHAVLEREIGLAAEGLNGLIEKGVGLVGALGVVEVDGSLGLRRQRGARGWFGAGLGNGQAGE